MTVSARSPQLRTSKGCCELSLREYQRMLIRAYGLFWSADEVNWHPGRGSSGQFMLLGRRGKNRPNLQLTDFRFSWFGFRMVLTKRDEDGLRELKTLSTRARGRMHKQIGELEALLISALGLENNFAKMRFLGAKPWGK